MKIYNLEGGAEYLMVSIDTMRDLVASGEVDGAKIGKAWVLTEAHLDEFLLKEIKKQTAARRNEPADKPALAALRQQLSAAQSRIELLEHDAKTGDYETLYAQTVVELSAAQASEDELLEALETLACLGNGDRYGSSQGNAIAQQAIATHKERKEWK